MKITLLEPYFTGSHASWAEGYRAASGHEIVILSLKGQYWKWRMHGGAVTLARKFMESDLQPDLILATDMLDLTTFLSLTRQRTCHIPALLYFHENQLSYPWSPDDRDILNQRDRHYGFINYSSALAADVCLFNTGFHRNSFLEELARYLKHFPDNNELSSIKIIEKKSSVLPLGLDLKKFDQINRVEKDKNIPLLILWNHRWEYDKNPEDFFKVMFRLAEENISFELALLGENFSRRPEIFETARERLGSRIVRFGYADSFETYASWLKKADILPVTSNHDFFGVSIAEAVYCGALPLLPKRLSYPEIIPLEKFRECFYEQPDDLYQRLKEMLIKKEAVNTAGLQKHISGYDWTLTAGEYDDLFLKIRRHSPLHNLQG